MVVIIHTGAFRELGWIGENITETGKFGVQIFFVISGFTIATTFFAAPSYSHYLLRRLFRIAPLYFSVILFSALLFNLALFPGNYWQAYFQVDVDAYNILMHLSFLSIFDHRIANSIIGVEWSIPIEVFWYIFLPAALVAIFRQSMFWIAFVLFILLAGIGVLAAHLLISEEPDLFVAWFPTTYGPYFLLGVAAYHIRRKPSAFARKHAARFLLLGQVLFVVSVMLAPPLVEVLLANSAMLLIAFYRKDDNPAFNRFFVSKPFIFVGSMSYSVYLLHFLSIRLVNLAVTSRQVIWLFVEQLRLEFVPGFHRLQGRLAAQG